MDRLLQLLTGDENAELVGPFTDNAASTKKFTRRNSIYLPFALIPHVIGQNLTPKTAVRTLVPVISSLGLECPQLLDFFLAAYTKTANNNPPVMVQDPDEVGLEHGLWLFKVINFRSVNILLNQLPAL